MSSIMKSGELFHFSVRSKNVDQPHYEFYNELTNAWTPIENNVFIALWFFDKPQCEFAIEHLFFTNGTKVFSVLTQIGDDSSVCTLNPNSLSVIVIDHHESR